MKLRLALLMVLAAGLGACGPGASDLDRYIAEVKVRKSRDIDPIPQIKPYQPFEYVMLDRRDPFVPVDTRDERAVNPSGLRPDLRRNREPLEEYPLDALRMVGVIGTVAGTYALVKSPDGVVHRVGQHQHMGQNNGEVVAIAESEVSLLELVADGFGGWTQRPASLALSQ